jgi:hypothetical protein
MAGGGWWPVQSIPHGPGAPQRPQKGISAPPLAVPDLLSPALTSDSARTVLREPHPGQSAAGLPLIVRKSFSNRRPHDSHVNS